MTAAPTVLLLAGAVIVLGFGMVLSAGEGALARMTRAAAEDLVEAGRRGAGRVAALTNRREQVLGTLAGLRAGVDMLAAILVTLGVAGRFEQWWQVLLVAIALNLVLLGLLVGVSPRSAGRRNPGATLLALAGVLERVDALGAPWRWLESRFGHASTLTDAEMRAEVTEDLREMIDEIGDSETIEDEDREMLRSVVELGQTLVREVMVPRTDMVTIDEDKPASAGLRLFIRSGYSRVPVIGEDADDVRGILYLKDVLRRLSDHPEHGERPVVSFVREAVYVPETKLADDLLREMQLGHFHIALAVDEYGGIAGLVTLEDLLEEVVGELTDEHDHAEPIAEDLGAGTFRVPVRLGLDALGELFDLEIEDDDVDTAGGLLTKAIGRVPLPGASGDVQGIHLVAEESAGRRRQVATLLASRSDAGTNAPTPGTTDRATEHFEESDQ
ncbi:hemolysin family protein [Actinomyces procaprae]|uniref:hemolysin family protein n=1 Tax=Actinomyces procaprae TaxID=2560010 RepID=UPI0010A2402F|nr:hemolysin family protein [Actinomyces procaprae]